MNVTFVDGRGRRWLVTEASFEWEARRGQVWKLQATLTIDVQTSRRTLSLCNDGTTFERAVEACKLQAGVMKFEAREGFDKRLDWSTGRWQSRAFCPWCYRTKEDLEGQCENCEEWP